MCCQRVNASLTCMFCTISANIRVSFRSFGKKPSDFPHSSLQVTVSRAIVFIFRLSESFLFSTVRKFCFHFTPHQLIWPFSAPVVCCLGYKALQYGIIVLYSFPSMQRRASFPWEEVGGSKLHISKYWFPPSLLLWESTSFHQKQKQSPHTQLSVWINTTIECFPLTETYFNCSLMSATCFLGLVSCLSDEDRSGSNYLLQSRFHSMRNCCFSVEIYCHTLR